MCLQQRSARWPAKARACLPMTAAVCRLVPGLQGLRILTSRDSHSQQPGRNLQVPTISSLCSACRPKPLHPLQPGTSRDLCSILGHRAKLPAPSGSISEMRSLCLSVREANGDALPWPAWPQAAVAREGRDPGLPSRPVRPERCLDLSHFVPTLPAHPPKLWKLGTRHEVINPDWSTDCSPTVHLQHLCSPTF